MHFSEIFIRRPVLSTVLAALILFLGLVVAVMAWIAWLRLRDVTAGVALVDLSRQPEADGVVALWMHRHSAHVALVRPDHYVYGTAATPAELLTLLNQARAALSA